MPLDFYYSHRRPQAATGRGTMHRARLTVAIITIMILGKSYAQESPSGVYLSATPELVELVQIVKTPDGRLAGRIASTAVNENGKLEETSFTIVGAVDGKQIIISAKSLLLHGDTSLTGFIDGDLLDLSWPGGHRTYQRDDTYAYQAAVTGLEAHAKQVRANALADRAQSELSAFIEIVTAVESQSADAGANLKDANDSYRKLYKKLHNRQRAARASRDSGFNHELAWNTEQEAYRLEQQIWRLDSEVARLHRQFAVSFDKAASYAASIQSFCAISEDSRSQKLCGELNLRDETLGQLKSKLQADFDSVAATINAASVDVPPAKRFLNKLVGD